MNVQLGDRVVTYLADRAATVPEIARAVRARDLAVRRLVMCDGRFERRPAPAGRNGHGRFYTLATGVVPRTGTSPAGREGGAAVAGLSPAVETAEGLWLLALVEGPRSVQEAIIAGSIASSNEALR